MATAKKLPSGNWFCRPYLGKDVNGKHIYGSITAPTKKQAELDAALLKHNHKKQEKQPVSMPLGTAIDRYIAAKEAILSPKTIKEYKGIRRNAFEGIMGTDIYALTAEQFQLAVNQYAATRSAKTVKNAVGLVTASLALFAPHLRLRASLPRGSKAQLAIPQEPLIKALVDDAQGPMKTALLLAAALGLRRSEICALTWDDLKGNQLTVSKAVVSDEHGAWHTKSTKTESGTRVMNVPAFILQHLKELPRDDERIVPLNPDAVTYRFITLRNKHQLSLRFHDLRHYYASLLLALGIPDKYAMERMGHATPNMLKNVYQHIMKDKQDEINQTINQALQDKFS